MRLLNQEPVPNPPTKVLVRSGALYKNGTGYETRKIKRLFHFPYRGDYMQAGGLPKLPDFVILEFRSPFTLIEGFVQPACLPTKSMKHGDVCFASGWGLTRETWEMKNSMSFLDQTQSIALRATKLKIKAPLQHCTKGNLRRH